MNKPKLDNFDDVARSAIDFMNRALSDIEKDPKLSVIYYWTALELFLKARLLKEHWTLILTHPDRADRSEFDKGGFVSVSFKEAIKRLKNICGLRVLGSENDCFETLRNHRNKLVHFYNPDYSNSSSKEVLAQVASEQCLGWFFLHKWLTEEWKDEFADYAIEINKIHGQVNQNRKFMNVKYEMIKPEIENLKSRGCVIHNCLGCGYQSCIELSKTQFQDMDILDTKCMVCDYNSKELHVPCPDSECSGIVAIEDIMGGSCPLCTRKMSISSLLDKYGESKSPKDELDEESNAYCSDCECTGAPSACGGFR